VTVHSCCGGVTLPAHVAAVVVVGTTSPLPPAVTVVTARRAGDLERMFPPAYVAMVTDRETACPDVNIRRWSPPPRSRSHPWS